MIRLWTELRAGTGFASIRMLEDDPSSPHSNGTDLAVSALHPLRSGECSVAYAKETIPEYHKHVNQSYAGSADAACQSGALAGRFVWVLDSGV